MTTYTRPLVNGTPTTGQVVKAGHVNEPIDQIYDTILAGGITADQIAVGAVDTSELATAAVTAVKMDGTLPDASAMATSAAPTLDAQLANKKYVDDLVTLDASGVLMHDAENGFMNADIDGSKTKVYTKYLTGTLGSSSPDTKAHGVSTALTKIMAVSVVIENTNVGSIYNVPGHQDGSALGAGQPGFQITFDATNINIIYGGDLDNGKFRIRVDYIL